MRISLMCGPRVITRQITPLFLYLTSILNLLLSHYLLPYPPYLLRPTFCRFWLAHTCVVRSITGQQTSGRERMGWV